jgi:hypothetical protein
MTQISEHFTFEDTYATTHRAWIEPNRAWAAARVPVMRSFAQTVLEPMRAFLGGHPVIPTSWVRCPGLNEVIGSASTSYHIEGVALDFTVPAYGRPYDVARALAASNIPFAQLIYEFGSWVHICAPLPGRIITPINRILTIPRANVCVPGIVLGA